MMMAEYEDKRMSLGRNNNCRTYLKKTSERDKF